MPSRDITYCCRTCGNMECKRNQKHIPEDAKYVSMSDFNDCEDYKEE